MCSGKESPHVLICLEDGYFLLGNLTWAVGGTRQVFFEYRLVGDIIFFGDILPTRQNPNRESESGVSLVSSICNKSISLFPK